MARKTRGIVTQIKEEATFNAGAEFTDADVVVANEASITPKTDMVDRKFVSCDIVKLGGVPVRNTTDGTISVEIVADTSGTDTDFFGKVLFGAGFGYKNIPGHAGDDTDKGKGGFVGKDSAGNDADMVSLADDNTAGTDIVYYVAPKSAGNTAGEVETYSIAVRKFYDADSVCLYTTGVRANKVDFSVPTADIITASFGVEGSDYTTPTDQTKPACSTITAAPFVGKSAVFKYQGNTVNAMDLQISVANTIANEDDLVSAGYSDKIITEKAISGSFKILFEDFSYLDQLKEQTIGTLYLNVKVGDNEFGIYLPRVKVQDYQVTDNSNMLVEATVNFIAETDANLVPAPEAILVGIK